MAIGRHGGRDGEGGHDVADKALLTPNLFAWTVVIVCISALIEKGFSRLIRMIVRRIEEGA